MDSSTKTLLGVLAAAGAVGAGYYFFVYKPKKDEENKKAKEKADADARAALPPGGTRTQVARPSSIRMAMPAASFATAAPGAAAEAAAAQLAAQQRARIAAMTQQRMAFDRTPAPDQPAPDAGGNVVSQKTGGSYKIPFVGGVAWGADADVTFDLPTVSLKANGDATVSVYDGADNLVGSYKLAQGQSIGIVDIIKAAQGA